MSRFLLALFALLLVASPASAQPRVSDVRIGDHGTMTRFVLELTEAPRYRVFTLPDPFRVVLDLSELGWEGRPVETMKGRGLVQDLRFGLFAPGISRVVLDVDRPVRLMKVFVIPPRDGRNHRLVVDIEPVSREAYFAGMQGEPFLSKQPLASVESAALPVPTPKPLTDERPVIVIDPGHGGVDPGALGVSGTYEKDLALAYGMELKRQLEENGNFRVVMTRDHDIFLRLRDRIEVAQRAKGDLFLSLHANTNPSGKVRGAAIYTLSEDASDTEAEALAAKENKADVIAGVDLSDQNEDVSKILIDLAQRETMNLSKQFANRLVEEMGRETALLRKTHRFAGFAVLKSPTVPSILVEIGYMSHPTEEKQLLDPDHQARTMGALVKAIVSYFEWQTSLKRS